MIRPAAPVPPALDDAPAGGVPHDRALAGAAPPGDALTGAAPPNAASFYGAPPSAAPPAAPPVLRRLDPGDAAAFRDLRLYALRTAADAFGATWEDERTRPLSAFAARLEGSVVLGAESGGHLLACAGLRRDEGPRDRHKAILWGVFVRAEARRHGVADALLRGLLRAAPAGVEQVRLTVSAGNGPARALYARLGFATYGLETRALKTPDGYIDEVLMAVGLPLP